MIDLSHQIAVVTGGGSGIGRAIAQRLSGLGAVVAVADLNADSARAVAETINSDGGSAESFEVDVTNVDMVRRFRRGVSDRMGPVSILVNNAGWSMGRPFVDTTPDFWSKVVAINFLGTVAMSHTFIPDMIERKHGHLVNIGSDAGRVGSMGDAVYAGAKGAVIAFTKSLAREVARYRINVNCVCPGPTRTPLLLEQPKSVEEAIVLATPFRRLAEPEEVANAVAYFVSEEAAFATGQVLSISGGLTMAG